MAGRKRPEPTAFSRAVGLLARREHSHRELRRKLEARGIEPDDVDAAMTRLVDTGLQDDARFAEMLVHSKISAGHGPQRIRAELGTHGIDDTLIDAAFAENDVDWLAEARRVIERRYSSEDLAEFEPRRKAIEFLLRRGFDLDVARAATKPAEHD